MAVLGFDVGGSSIKAALVNTNDGSLLSELISVKTPQPATPAAICEQINLIRKQIGHAVEAIGVALPAVITGGKVRTAANIDASWINSPCEKLSQMINVEDVNAAIKTTQKENTHSSIALCFINDADAAGLAEMTFGRGVHCLEKSTTLVLTLGTGIGSSLFIGHILFPNTELGHLNISGLEAEYIAAAARKTALKLSWQDWAQRLNQVIACYEDLLWPDTIILGGAISSEFEKFQAYIKARAKIYPAQLNNQAGLIGAALNCQQKRTP